MSSLTSTKPYMIRALHEWCTDNALTPHLLVAVNGQTRVPMAYVKDGEIVLNLNYSATKDLLIGNDAITFSARFNGVATNLYIPMSAVRGLFARENGQGMFFEAEPEEVSVAADQGMEEETSPQAEKQKKTKQQKPSLKLVK
ncbi:MAG TPA: ClpXP protease specificity-enhancing factor [Methylophilaceae bacterium]|nr:ClpXP protease specificity-enhancing factor [Methylophilaceae bacterium]